ncbi:RnfABCDGE type electron transport complex subunit D [Kaistia dalseonensis]|uniref:Ferredoxin-NADP reductase/Na+-translocating ferredoxin:NAD+ oxidoreductase RnfD subunit n=1 Tax=Kaistia dalseonensis TaxID=410840 RepID=A0ABU0HCX9_9HYPH|nr:RnfABCDGE type electron transport complex subunit D [Kaistia dalseonensis]MCX5497537.1 RnfABCDGE type electron transport complex subunit D [Kaistia dalseonensis]MDQ0440176.1 ferredoxin-NADP reductase/Na+-translocating ferredoxin:NAD+ oxidoreductase RnfD subunit [Kaistia dalseonensis]
MNTIVDRFLNHVTMYRLVLFYVAGLLAVSFGLGFFKLVPHDPTALAFSGVVILAVCWLTNRLFAILFRVPVNTESIYITALILALIMPPVTASNLVGVAGLAVASVVAIASKFLLAIGRKHIFNPVAIGVFASAMLLDQPATWWVGGNMTLLPFVLVGGLLVVRKVQRFDMIGVYILANLVATLATTTPEMYGEALSEALIYSPLFFAGFAMLTEPLTAPHAKIPRLIYGALVGALSSPNVHIGSFYLSPEVAFLVGNLFAYAVSPKGRFKLTLLRIEKMASGCYDFVFATEKKLAFKAGQYLDWTLHVRHPDDRGNRRPFTIASAPTEGEVRLGVKFYPGPSAFKRTLSAMKPGDVIYGSQIAGSFTLPRNETEKLAFIAGGIGVTPFRSMVQDMIDRKDRRPAILLYGNNRLDEIAYADIFDRAERELGLRTVYAVAEPHAAGSNLHQGLIDEALIQREIPDFRDRTFYISGPRAMVVRFQRVLKHLGVARSRIHVDFFPGFA